MNVVKVDEEAKPKKSKGAIKMRDIVIFTRQFSTMINAGLPLVQALDILAKQTENKALGRRHPRRRLRRRVRVTPWPTPWPSIPTRSATCT